MSKSTKEKFQPIIIVSREAMTTVVNDYVRDRIDHAQLTLEMEEEIARAQKHFQERLDKLGRRLACAEAGLQVWAETHRATEFAEKKSIDLQLATIGFRDTPPRVEKTKGKDTFDAIAIRLAGIVLRDAAGQPVFIGENYVKYAEPKLDKEGLLGDRKTIPAEALKLAGLRFESDELFYITPKSDVLEGKTTEVAA